MDDDDDLLVRFWGVRGSIAVSGQNSLAMAATRSALRCVAVSIRFCSMRVPACGLPARHFGRRSTDFDLFFTLPHDHIIGLPAFRPCMNGASNTLWSGISQDA